MDDLNATTSLAAIEAIRRGKARYFRGVDTADGELVRGILAESCVLDYLGCCTDPATGRDFLPAMNVVLRGRDSWSSDGLRKAGIVSVHQHHQADIELTGANTATAIFAMTDRLYMPAGAAWEILLGFGFYHETWIRQDDRWQLQTLRIERLRVEVR